MPGAQIGRVMMALLALLVVASLLIGLLPTPGIP